MPRKKNQESQEEQSRRFKEMARELGVDENDEEALDRALKKIGEYNPKKDEGGRDGERSD